MYSCADIDNDKKIMNRYAKNYLPILFNMYTTPCKGTDEDAARFSAFETIKVWSRIIIVSNLVNSTLIFRFPVQVYLSIADFDLVNDLSNRALEKLESGECKKSKFTKESVLDLTRLILPYQKGEWLKKLYNQINRVLEKEIDFKEEKKYYR